MPQRRRRRCLAELGLFLGTSLLTAGCETLPHLPLMARRAEPEAPQAAPSSWRERVATAVHRSPTPTADVLQPQSVVYWTALPGAGSSTSGYRGRSTVGPDGNLKLGPYGSVHVAGLTAEQARAAVTRQVAQQLPQPRVSLSLVPPAQEGEAVAHNAGNQGVQRTGHTAATGPTLTDTPNPSEHRLVAATGQTLAVTPRDDPPQTMEPANAPSSTPELPFPRTAPSYPAWGHAVPGVPGVPGRAPNELNKTLMPSYIIEPPDILLIEYRPVKPLEGTQPIRGQHLVNPDGTVRLGSYGQVRVAGLTLDAARQAIADLLRPLDTEFNIKFLSVDVLAYNSKVYYVITDGAGYGAPVRRFHSTGNETVLDAISLIDGLPPVSSKKHIWVARRNSNGGFDSMLPVDWIGITQRGSTSTNYQVLPGDRIYVQSD